MPVPSSNIFTYLLSFFGFGPVKTEHVIQQPTYAESSCSFQTESTFYVSHQDIDHHQYKKRTPQDVWAFQDWISRLSKVALCQILTSTISDYPQVADRIENIYGSLSSATRSSSSSSSSTSTSTSSSSSSSSYSSTFKRNDDDDWLDSILFIQERARTIAHSLDNLRPSEQFGRSSEVAESIQGLIHLCTQHRTMGQTMSHVTLFSLIILAHESLQAPTEVRQHVFFYAKLGRTIVLELSSVLKNFRQTPNLDPYGQWERVSSAIAQYNDSDDRRRRNESWVDALDRVCIKLARYDVTWEYRQEYNQVVEIATRLYNTKIIR